MPGNKVERRRIPLRPAAFALRFCGYATVTLAIYYFASAQNIIGPFLSLLATLVGKLIDLTGTTVKVSGQVVLIPGVFGIDIADECSGISHLLLFCSAVLAYPGNLRSRMLGILMGVVAVFIVNLIRLATLLWIGVHAQAYFSFIHSYLWGGIGYLGIVLLWFLWLRLSDRHMQAH